MNIAFNGEPNIEAMATEEDEALGGIDAELDAAILAMIKGGCGGGGGGGGGKKGKKKRK